MKRVTRREILDVIGCPHLSLRKSTYPMRDARFVFTYEKQSQTLGTHWVHVDQLNHMYLEACASLGKAFVAKAEAAA